MLKRFIFVVILLACTKPAQAGMSDLEAAIMLGDWNSAQKMARSIISQSPDKEILWKAKYYLGISSMESGHFLESRQCFNDLTDKDISAFWRDRALLGIADSYFMEERYDEALPVLRRLLSSTPGSDLTSLIYLKYGRVNFKLANWDEAKTYLKKIIEEYPESLDVSVAKQLVEEKHYFAVQVGSFLERQRAEKLVQELNSKNEYAYIVETSNHQAKRFYRVRVGQLAKLDDAQRLKDKLSEKGYPTQIFP